MCVSTQAACVVLILICTTLLTHGQDEATILPEPQAKKPSENWTAQDSANDESGESAQDIAPGFVYADDRYENLDYNSNAAGSADIKEVSIGIDKDFIYISFAFQEPWSESNSQAHTVGIEIDTDYSFEANRGDYFVHFQMRNEFDDKEKWKDARDEGGYSIARDNNNNVGGADPLASNYPNATDGYEDQRNNENDKVFGRVMDDGDFEVAIKRDHVDAKDEPFIRIRVWTRQSATFNEGDFHINDSQPELSIDAIDSYPGARQDDWLELADTGENDVDLSLSQTVDNPSARPGELVTFTITLAHTFGE